MSAPKVVHVVGTGTIGEPLIGLLISIKDELGIDEVTFHKRTPLLTDRSKVVQLRKRGARIAVDAEARQGFVDLGIKPDLDTLEAFERASVVIDCTPSKVGLANKAQFYEKYLDSTAGFIAQGSEFGFGKMYARGINDSALTAGEDRFIQVVSCNTHNLALLVDLIGMHGGGPENVKAARFLCIRRSNDISQDGSFVPAPQVGGHHDDFGSHHARDAYHLFKTLGYEMDSLFSSAMKVNTQYMHTIWFSIQLAKPTTTEEIMQRFVECDRAAITHKMSANAVFSFGRDYGHYGRLLNETVLVAPSLAIRDGGHEVVGFCFTPQDGNSLLSSVSAAAWLMDPEGYNNRVQCLRSYFFDEV
jgi:glyceraldehyde-3-phosphate dehydrogenase/erythrose-4-phosphate dehydrogenase